MLTLETIKKSSELSSLNSKQKNIFDTKTSEKKLTLASSIVREFLNSIMNDTLQNPEPTKLYEYDVDPTIDLKFIRARIDEIVYPVFVKNIYAIPDIFCKEDSTSDPINKIIIHATNTVKCITTTDIKLENEISELILRDSSILESGNAIVYTGFEHLCSNLPRVYATTRCEAIQKLLNEKGYAVTWDPTSMFLVIAIK